MKLKLSQIVALVQAKTVERLEGSKPPWKIRLLLAQLVDALLVEYRRFERLQADAVKQYGVADPERKGYIVVQHPANTVENMQAFNDAILALLESDIELAVRPLDLSELELDLTTGDVRLLRPLLVENAAPSAV
jgi:hypothetical protein